MGGEIIIVLLIAIVSSLLFGILIVSKYGHKGEKQIKAALNQAAYYQSLLQVSNQENHELKSKLKEADHEIYRMENTGRFLQQVIN